MSDLEVEVEANLFARMLLMPEDWLRREVKEPLNQMLDIERVSALAKRYDVDEMHMTMRLVELGLLR